MPNELVAKFVRSDFIAIVSTIVDGHYLVPLFAHYRSPSPAVPGGPRRRLTVVAVDGAKMRAVASPKNIAGAERPARGIAYTENEIAYYLDRLDIIDETVAQGFEDNAVEIGDKNAASADQVALPRYCCVAEERELSRLETGEKLAKQFKVTTKERSICGPSLFGVGEAEAVGPGS